MFNLNTTTLRSVWPSSSLMVPIEVSQLSFPSLLCHLCVKKKKWDYLNHWITTQGEIKAPNMSAHSIPQSMPCAKLSSRERVKSSLHDPQQIPILSPQVLSPPSTVHTQALPACLLVCPHTATSSYVFSSLAAQAIPFLFHPSSYLHMT